MASAELAALPAAAGEPPRFTSRDMLEAEKSLMRRAAAMQGRRGHGVALPPPGAGLPPDSLTERQRSALDYLAAEGDIKAFAVTDESGTGALLAAMRGLCESRGLRVVGLALSRSAAEHFQACSGIPSLTLALQEEEWKAGRDPCSANHVIVVEGAEMIGLKQLERLLAVVDQARGKVVLLGESRQLEAMGSLSALRGILDKVGPPAPASAGLDIR
jgi:AAA domain